jgi:hypothetical protein
VDSGSGDYYLPDNPDRLLDTRKSTGSTGPVPANGTVTLSVPQCVSGSGASQVTAPADAIALNLTVTAPASGGYLTAYPDQTTAPTASNVNFTPNETVPHMVVVKVGADGKVELHNSSPGTVQLVADLEGCYSTTLGDAFVPVTPYRALDTRTGLGQNNVDDDIPMPVPGYGNANWDSYGSAPDGSTAFQGSAAVLNVTITQPKSGGVITAYPLGSQRPLASNLNFGPGETVPNLVMVDAPGFGVALYNGSNGTADLIVDVYGYFS